MSPELIAKRFYEFTNPGSYWARLPAEQQKPWLDTASVDVPPRPEPIKLRRDCPSCGYAPMSCDGHRMRCRFCSCTTEI